VHILGATGPARDPDSRLAVARTLDEIQLLDARRVCGCDHLLAAYEHAQRAMREGTNLAKTLAVEFVLYAAGERQISDAIRKVGIRDDTEEFALVTFGGLQPDEVLRALDLSRDDRVLEPSRQKLRAFGITELELTSVPLDRASDLVLERVALVDLFK